MDQHEQTDWITHLKTMDVEVDMTPLATTLSTEGISATGETFEEALARFLEKALKEVRSLRQWKADTMPIVSDWSLHQ